MTFDADKLRSFIERYDNSDVVRRPDARYLTDRYLWNNRAAILAMAEENKRLREALQDLQGDGSASGTWAEAVEPLIARFNVAAQFGADAVHNGDGAKAIADLMQSMADRLDRACTIARRALGKEQS